MSNFIEKQQAEALRKYGTVKSDSDYKKDGSSLYYSTKEIVSDTLIAVIDRIDGLMCDGYFYDDAVKSIMDDVKQANEANNE